MHHPNNETPTQSSEESLELFYGCFELLRMTPPAPAPLLEKCPERSNAKHILPPVQKRENLSLSTWDRLEKNICVALLPLDFILCNFSGLLQPAVCHSNFRTLIYMIF